MDYLAREVLTAIIDKKIVLQGYRAAQLLLNYVIKGEYPPSGAVQISPSILLGGNAAEDFDACC